MAGIQRGQLATNNVPIEPSGAEEAIIQQYGCKCDHGPTCSTRTIEEDKTLSSFV